MFNSNVQPKRKIKGAKKPWYCHTYDIKKLKGGD